MKQIAFVANEQEQRDFEQIRAVLERNSDADTIRAMISFCKKNLLQNVDISTPHNHQIPADN